MARYRVEFSRDWILGRWGFTDRVFYELGGVVTEPSRLENAWLVEFKGKPRALGQILARKLGIQQGDRRWGTIFEIMEMPPPARKEPRPTVIDPEPVFAAPDDGPSASGDETIVDATEPDATAPMAEDVLIVESEVADDPIEDSQSRP